MKDNEIKDLFERFKAGQSNDEEIDQIRHWLHNLNASGSSGLSKDDLRRGDKQMWQAISQQIATPHTAIYKNWPLRIATVAASIAIILTIWTVSTKKDIPLQKSYANDINPGGDKATLTLANGKTINLSDAKKGALANDHGVEIIKMPDGQLLFRFNPATVTAKGSRVNDSISSLVSGTNAVKDGAGLNAVVTPRGGQYHIALPDGTNVWINAGSTLRFPSSFWDMPERRVHLTGEAYFEVAQVKSIFGMQKRAKRVPFIVQTDKQEVTVLGTHFNINSYSDEPSIKTTLLEGLVKVSSKGGDAVLKPGMQAVNNGTILRTQNVDIDQTVAWKNGEFAFINEPLENIMRQISRWYTVDVIYENPQIKRKTFGGSISKFSKVSQVLCMLELAGDIKFRIEGRRITVMK